MVLISMVTKATQTTSSARTLVVSNTLIEIPSSASCLLRAHLLIVATTLANTTSLNLAATKERIEGIRALLRQLTNSLGGRTAIGSLLQLKLNGFRYFLPSVRPTRLTTRAV